MAFALTYDGPGRGSFPDRGAQRGFGGTLNVTGTAPGGYYRAPAAGSGLKMPGLTGALAIRNKVPCTINDYAVYSAVKALQVVFKADPDGIFGNNTGGSVSTYQKEQGLVVDGVVGPATCKSLWTALVLTAVMQAESMLDRADTLRRVTLGTIGIESVFDHGAVGVTTPDDLGVGQINSIHSINPAQFGYISTDDRLNPVKAIPWVVSFVASNLKALNYDEDAGIVAYNLGVSGAKAWITAGRPQMFRGADVWAYLSKIKTVAG